MSEPSSLATMIQPSARVTSSESCISAGRSRRTSVMWVAPAARVFCSPRQKEVLDVGRKSALGSAGLIVLRGTTIGFVGEHVVNLRDRASQGECQPTKSPDFGRLPMSLKPREQDTADEHAGLCRS
jgi:hypothetical protein